LVVARLSLPNNLSYTFGYERTGASGSNYRELRTLTLPTGAKIEYGYRLDGNPGRVNWFYVLANTIASKKVYVDSEVVENWIYDYQFIGTTGSYSHSVHTAPDGGTTNYDFQTVTSEWNPRPGDGTITKIVYPDGSILDREWQYNFPYEKPTVSLRANPWIWHEWRTNASGGGPVATSIKVYAVDKNGNSTSVEERGWVSYSSSLPAPSSAALIRKTVNTYVNGATDSANSSQDPKSYSYGSSLPATPRNLPASKEIQNGSGVVQSRSQFSYDEVSPVRNVGNLAAEYHWDSTKPGYSSISPGMPLSSSNSIVKTYGYTTRGNVSSETDARGSTTTHDYGNVSGCPPDGSTRTDLYRTGVHQGEGVLNWSYVYSCNSGLRTDETDPNLMVTNTIYDNFGRPTTITEGSYRKTVHTYNDLSRWVVTQRDVEIFGDQRNVAIKHYDPLGRVRLSRQLEIAVSDPTAAATNEALGIRTDTKYVYSTNRNETWVSNPYRIDEASAPTRGWSVKRLEKMGRVCVEESFAGAGTPSVADNCQVSAGSTGSVTHTYEASPSWTSEKVVDAAGKVRRLYQDVLGRLVAVVEDPDNARYHTYYSYDPMDNLIQTRQVGTCGGDPVAGRCSGGQTRTFAYTSLNRLFSATNSEMGGNTLNYEHDENGNMKSKSSSGSPGLLVSYTYDSLNRAKTREYNDGTTPAVTYCYDGKTWSGSSGSCSGSPSVPSKGHLTEVASTVSKTSYAYNSSGQITGSTQATAGQSFAFGYSFSASSALATETYPSGRTIATSYDDAGRARYLRGQSGVTVVNYAGKPDGLIQYASHGAISSMTMGNGIIENRSYNSRLQPTRIQAGSLITVRNCYQVDDDAGCPAVITASGNNGNVQGQSIVRSDKSWTQKYTYDAINRLASVSETGNWQQSYEYDAYGNRSLYTPASYGLPVSPLTPTSQGVFDHATNRLVGTGNYDSRGDLILYGGFTLTYDGDGRISSARSSAQSTKYEYDGEGHRVRSYVCSGSMICMPGAGTTTTTYAYDAFGKLAAEYGMNPETGGRSYFTSDHLGSTRLETDADGRPVKCSDYLPFGEEIGSDIGGRPTCFAPAGDAIKFTGKERDKETGLDYFLARYFSSAQGRFSSPDIAGPALPNPQTLNKYQYALNNPLKYIDPSGLYEEDVHRDLTAVLAMAAGFDEETANAIAAADQGVDDNYSSASYSNRKDYHFTTLERRNELWSTFEKTGTANDLGVFMHTEQDSYSHEGYGPKLGHASAGTAPDKTYNDPAKANTMAQDAFSRLASAVSVMGVNPAHKVAWGQISELVGKFNKEKSIAEKKKILDKIKAIVNQSRGQRNTEEDKKKRKTAGAGK
jgi:RHS repeat-associated protein